MELDIIKLFKTELMNQSLCKDIIIRKSKYQQEMDNLLNLFNEDEQKNIEKLLELQIDEDYIYYDYVIDKAFDFVFGLVRKIIA